MHKDASQTLASSIPADRFFGKLALSKGQPQTPALYFFKLTVFFIVSVLLIGYFSFCPAVQKDFYYSHMIFPGSTYEGGNYDVVSLVGSKREDVYFKTVDGKKLHGWFFRSANPRGVALLHHGNGGNLTTYLNFIELFLMTGYSVLVYDYEGYGKSEGSPTLQGILRDGDAAYSYLRDTMKVKSSDIVNVGISLGTAPASYLASKSESKGLILLSPYSSLFAVGRDMLPPLKYFPDWTYPEADIGSAGVFKNLKVPTLIVQGTKDTLIPPQHARDLHKMAPIFSTLSELQDVGHVDVDWLTRDDFQRTLLAFLNLKLR